MGLLTSGAMAEVGGGKYVKLDGSAPNVMYILHDSLKSINSAPKNGVFVKSKGPFNAAWVYIGAEDVGNELGLRPTPKAFIWVLQAKNPKDLSEGFETKLWEATKAMYEAVATQVNEYGTPLQGMQVTVSKVNGRWNPTANTPKKGKEVPAAVLEAAWAEIVAKGLHGKDQTGFNEAAFYDVIGAIQSKALQRKFLIEKATAQGKPAVKWNDILKMFGLPDAADGGGAGADDDDVGEY